MALLLSNVFSRFLLYIEMYKELIFEQESLLLSWGDALCKIGAENTVKSSQCVQVKGVHACMHKASPLPCFPDPLKNEIFQIVGH